jgi:hypothetical protein
MEKEWSILSIRDLVSMRDDTSFGIIGTAEYCGDRTKSSTLFLLLTVERIPCDQSWPSSLSDLLRGTVQI